MFRRARLQGRVEKARKGGDELALAHALRHLGDFQRERGDLAGARLHLESAVAIYRRHPEAPRLDVANALRPMALLLAASGEREPARDLFEEARELYNAVGVEAGVIECDAWLAKLAGG